MQEKTCIQCGKTFTISDEEIAFFQRKNLSIPKRCQACRNLNKQKKQDKNRSMVQGGGVQTFNQKSKPKKGWTQWFIAGLLLLLGLSGVSFWENLRDESNAEDSNQTLEVTQALSFREQAYAIEHFQKHGDEFDYQTVEQYIAGANRVISSPKALHKTEREDGDDVYYLEETNEFVIVSTDGYIRTYFKPADGLDYYHRQ